MPTRASVRVRINSWFMVNISYVGLGLTIPVRISVDVIRVSII
jgi:hypothetical protein